MSSASTSPPGSNASQGASDDIYVVSAACEDKKDIAVRILVGEYGAKGDNHGRRVYQKRCTPDCCVHVFLYFWDNSDGLAFEGWWLGNKVGGDKVFSHCPSVSQTPPKSGWKVPWDGAVVPTLTCAVKSQNQHLKQHLKQNDHLPPPPPLAPSPTELPTPLSPSLSPSPSSSPSDVWYKSSKQSKANATLVDASAIVVDLEATVKCHSCGGECRAQTFCWNCGAILEDKQQNAERRGKSCSQPSRGEAVEPEAPAEVKKVPQQSSKEPNWKSMDRKKMIEMVSQVVQGATQTGSNREDVIGCLAVELNTTTEKIKGMLQEDHNAIQAVDQSPGRRTSHKPSSKDDKQDEAGDSKSLPTGESKCQHVQRAHEWSAENDTQPQWEFELSTGAWQNEQWQCTWQKFHDVDNNIVEMAWKQCCAAPQDGSSTIQVERAGTLYNIDFAKMEQMNLSTHRCRRIRRLLTPESPPPPQSRMESGSRSEAAEPINGRLSELRTQQLKRKDIHRKALESELADVKRQRNELLAKVDASREGSHMEVEVERKRSQSFLAWHKRLESELNDIKCQKDQLETQLEIDWEDHRIQMEIQRSHHDTELEKHRKQIAIMQEEMEQQREQISSMQADIEHWRCLPLAVSQLPVPRRQPRPNLVQAVQSMLSEAFPASHANMHHCRLARHVKVKQVYEIQNASMWKGFCCKKEEVAAQIQDRKDCPWAANILPLCSTLKSHLTHISVNHDANEVLLLHGTKDVNINGIIKQGFDARLSEYTLYGAGTYFTTEICKALQYSDLKGANHSQPCSGHFFIARVVLGHAYLAKGPMKSHKRPPMADAYGMPYDSVVARPGIPNDRPGGQVHHEVVVADSQAYPELLVHFDYVP